MAIRSWLLLRRPDMTVRDLRDISSREHQTYDVNEDDSNMIVFVLFIGEHLY